MASAPDIGEVPGEAGRNPKMLVFPWADGRVRLSASNAPGLFFCALEETMDAILIGISKAATLLGWKYGRIYSAVLEGRFGEVTRIDGSLHIERTAVERYVEQGVGNATAR